MRVETMKRIDRWAGGLGCFLLDAVELLSGWMRRARPAPEHVRVVLITKYLGMGSIILAAPTVERIRERYPQARIVFLTFGENLEIARMLGVFDEILTVDSKSLAGLVRDTLAALGRLWSLGVDVVCDLEFFARYSTLMAYLSGARVRVGYFSRIAWRGHLLTHPVYYNGTKHITRIFLAQAEILGARIEAPEPVSLPALAEDEAAGRRAREALEKQEVDGGAPLLVVNPNASALCLERRWMPERFASVVDTLLEENEGLHAVFIGSASEAGYTRSAAERCRARDRVAVLAGELGVAELAELLRQARLFLTNDSGPLHLAALVDTPTVSLFGPETPTLYGPLGRRQRLFYAGVYCSPCLNVYNAKTAACGGDNICLQHFGSDGVLDACRELLLGSRETIAS